MSRYLVERRLLDAKDDQWQERLSLLDHVHNLVLLLRDDEIVFANRTAAKLLGGGDAATLLESGLADLFHHDYLELAALGAEALVEDGMIPLKFIRRNGSEMDVEMWVRRLDNTGPEVFLLEARDITDHLRAARALRSREQFLEGIINTVADGIITIDARGQIRTFNPAAERIFGFKSDEVLGKSIRQLIPDPLGKAAPPDSEIGMEWQHLLTQAAEVQAQRKGGEAFPIEMAIRELYVGNHLSFTSVVRDISARKRAEERIRHMAHHDQLTGLPNRFLFSDRLDEALVRAERHEHRVGLFFIDLDRFKPINDRHGHAVGDRVLVELANRLKTVVRRSDTIARLGGDEFVVVAEELKDLNHVAKVARKILTAFTEPVETDGLRLDVGVSVGISVFPDHGSNGHELIHQADLAMYEAKRDAGNTFRIAPARGPQAEAAAGLGMAAIE